LREDTLLRENLHNSCLTFVSVCLNYFLIIFKVAAAFEIALSLFLEALAIGSLS